MALSYLRNPSIERLPVLVEWLRSGDLRIPPFQRNLVWTGKQRLALCDTIRQGLPAGSLMVWRTTRAISAKGFRGAFNLGLREPDEGVAQQYLLDGLQRMTTVFAALGPALWTREEEETPWWDEHRLAPDGTPWAIGFDVSANEGGFCFMGTDGSAQPEGMILLPLDVLLDDEAYDDWRVAAGLTREQKNKARAIRTAFVDYLIPVVPLATNDLQPVTLTFKRINAGGTPMGDFDMHRALTWRDEFDLENVLEEEVRPQLEPLGWRTISKDDVLKVIATGYGLEPVEVNVEVLCGRIVNNPSVMDAVPASLLWAIGVLHELGFRGPATLPYTYILVFAARCWQIEGAPLSAQARQRLVRWLAEAAVTERFSSQPPHMIRAAWRELEETIGGRSRRKRPRVGKPRPSAGVNFGWARPVVTAAVLALQRPRDGGGEEMYAASRLLGESGRAWFSKLLVAKQLRGADRETTPRSAQNTAANFVVCDSARLERLRERLRDTDCPSEILESHAISPEAHALFIARDWLAFLEARFATIIERENAWLESHGSDLEVSPP